MDDALVMGGVHVRAWQSAYRGQMPDEYLDGLSAQERAQMWSDALARPDDSRAILVVHEREVVGFAAVGPAADAPSTGELYSINIEPDRWGRGYGRALLARAEVELAALGYDEAVYGSCQAMSVLVASTRRLGGHPTEQSESKRFWESSSPRSDTAVLFDGR